MLMLARYVGSLVCHILMHVSFNVYDCFAVALEMTKSLSEQAFQLIQSSRPNTATWVWSCKISFSHFQTLALSVV